MSKMAAISSTIKQVAPNAGLRMMTIKGISAADGDTMTVTGLQAIEGCIGFSTTGVAASYSYTSNIITINNGGTLTWNFIVWGY